MVVKRGMILIRGSWALRFRRSSLLRGNSTQIQQTGLSPQRMGVNRGPRFLVSIDAGVIIEAFDETAVCKERESHEYPFAAMSSIHRGPQPKIYRGYAWF